MIKKDSFILLTIYLLNFLPVFAKPNSDIDAKKMLELARYFYEREKYQSCIDYIKKAENKIKSDTNSLDFAELCDLKAELLIKRDKKQEAEYYITRAIAIKKEMDEEKIPSLALSYRVLGNVCFYKKNYDSSIIFYKKGLSIAILNKNKEEVAKSYTNLGLIAKIKKDYIRAESYYLKSLEIKKNIHGEHSPQMAKLYSHLSSFYYELKQYDESLFYAQKAQRIVIDNYGDNSFLLVDIYNLISHVHVKTKDFKIAQNYKEKAIKIIEVSSFVRDFEILIELYYNLADILVLQNEHERAVVKLLHAEILSRQHSNYRLSSIFNKFIDTYNYILESEKARIYLKKLKSYLIKSKQWNSFNKIDYYKQLSYIEMNAGNYNKALNSINKALNIESENNFQDKLYWLYYRRGMVFLREAEFKKKSKRIYGAIEDFNRCLNLSLGKEGSSFDTSSYSLSKLAGTSVNEWLYFFRAKSYVLNYENTRDISDLNMAMSSFLLAIDIVLYKNSKRSFLDEQMYWTERLIDWFQEPIDLCYKLYDLTNDIKYKETALDITEKLKAFTLKSSKKDVKAKEFAGVNDSLLRKEKKIKGDISLLEELIYKEENKEQKDKGKLATWKDNLNSARIEEDKLIQLFKTQYPKYYKYKTKEDLVSYKEVMKKMSENSAVLDYVFGEQVLYMLYASEDEFEMYSIAPKESILRDIERLRELFDLGNLANHTLEYDKEFKSLLFKMYSQLIGPVKDKIKGKELVIMPDEKLYTIPFDVLLADTTGIKPGDYRKLNYLIKEHPISYSYSFSFHDMTFEPKEKEGKDVLACSPVYYSNSTLGGSGAVRGKEKLGDLIWAEKELEEVTEKIKGRILLKNNATERNFKQKAPDYKIIHLATHANVDYNNPMHSGLFFYQDKNLTEDLEDGILKAHEIYNMNFNADLAVLSTCNSGAGKIQFGEGAMSLSRSFFFAGCPSIVMTLWSIDDKSTCMIMSEFYKYLYKGNSKSIAMQRSKLSFLSKADALQAHPYFWSGYVSIGNQKAIYPNPYKKLIYWGCAIIFVCIIVWRYRKPNSKRIG